MPVNHYFHFFGYAQERPDAAKTRLIVELEVVSEKQKKDTSYANSIERFNLKLKEQANFFWKTDAGITYVNEDELEKQKEEKMLKNAYVLYHDIHSSAKNFGSRTSPIYVYSSVSAMGCSYYDEKGQGYFILNCSINEDPTNYEVGLTLLMLRCRAFKEESFDKSGVGTKTLLIDEEMLYGGLTKEMVTQFYKFPIEIATEQEIDNKVRAKDDQYIYVMAVGVPEYGDRGLIIFMMNINGSAADYKLGKTRLKHKTNRKYTHFIDGKLMTEIYKINERTQRGYLKELEKKKEKEEKEKMKKSKN